MEKEKTNKAELYFLPGTMCDQRVWQQVFELLAPHYDCHFVTLPQLSDTNSIVQALAQQLPNKAITLIGFSMGGYLSALYSATYPQRVARLAVISNSLGPLPEKEVRQRQGLVNWVLTHGYQGITRRKIAQMIDCSQANNHNIFETIKAMDAILGGDVLLQQLQAMTTRVDLSEAMVKRTAATLFCFGDNDPIVNQSWLSQIANQSDLISAQCIVHCGHYLPLEKPEALSEQLIQWLADTN